MNETVLLIEDDENDIFFLNRVWKQAGITAALHAVENGQAGIDYLKNSLYGDRQQSPLPGLVLLDLKLPRVMGLDVLKWIRSQPELQTTIVIIFTSSKLNSDIDTAYRLGANSYLVKPGTADKLLQIAKLINEYWLGINRPALECSTPVLEMA